VTRRELPLGKCLLHRRAISVLKRISFGLPVGSDFDDLKQNSLSVQLVSVI